MVVEMIGSDLPISSSPPVVASTTATVPGGAGPATPGADAPAVSAVLEGPEAATEGVEAARALVRVARMLERSLTELSLPQYRLLVMVAGGDHRASQLAGRLALSRPTITAVVEGLVERGCLARSVVSGDRRAVQLSLTDDGHAMLARADAAIEQRLAGILGRCDDPALAAGGLLQLAGALQRIVAEQMADGGK
jgi:DNA-binding MarR family transcriptional regulator